MDYEISRKGFGQTPCHAYKITKSGVFGNLLIDAIRLTGHHRLTAFDKNGTVVMVRDVDPTAFDLLTKRFNNKISYSPHVIQTFRYLIQLSNLPFHPSQKYKKLPLGASQKGGGIMPYSNINQLLSKLKLDGEIDGGNNSMEVRNDDVAIIDEMRRIGHLKKSDYEIFFKEYFQI